MFRWGILGTGRIARKFATAVAQSDTARVIAVASRNVTRAAEMGQAHAIERTYGEYAALLDDPDVDGVYIALPNSLHAEWAIATARAGKHILCEKPIGCSSAEAAQMFAAAEAHHVLLMEAFMYRFHPQTQHVQDLIGAGVVGTVQLVRVDFGLMLDRPDDVRWNPKLGGGALLDVGSYAVNFARMIVGERPVRVSATARWAQSGVDALLAATIEYPGGAVAQIACDYVSSFHQTAQVIGSDGVIALDRAFTMPPDQPSAIKVWRGAHFAALELIEIAAVNQYRLEAEGFAMRTVAHNTAGMPQAETLDNMATIEALLASARTGAPVALTGAV